jgi:hypothetical protein
MRQAFAVAAYWLLVSAVSAYEVETHEAISKSAAGQSVLAAPSKLQEMGLRPLQIDDPQQAFQNQSRGHRYQSWISFDSEPREDDLSALQALRHFYDPVRDRPLVDGDRRHLTSIKSPDWALEDLGTYTAPLAAQVSRTRTYARSITAR